MQPALTIGAKFHNRYEIFSHLADGGMSTIYIVKDTSLGNKKFILKSMCVYNFPDQNKEHVIERFRSEAIILANLNHPQLPRVTDFFVSDNNINFYLVMDYIEGSDLAKQLSQKNKFTEAEVIRITIEVLTILEYLHGEGIISRDIKPSNIMIKPDGTIVLIDFGIALKITVNKNIISAQSMTTQTLVGTPVFTAREQYFGNSDPRSDLHALAVTMYVLLTGLTLSPEETLKPIKQVCPEISDALADIIDKNTDHRIDFRHQSASEMKSAIQQINKPINNKATATKIEKYNHEITNDLQSLLEKKIEDIILSGIGRFKNNFLYNNIDDSHIKSIPEIVKQYVGHGFRFMDNKESRDHLFREIEKLKQYIEEKMEIRWWKLLLTVQPFLDVAEHKKEYISFFNFIEGLILIATNQLEHGLNVIRLETYYNHNQISIIKMLIVKKLIIEKSVELAKRYIYHLTFSETGHTSKVLIIFGREIRNYGKIEESIDIFKFVTDIDPDNNIASQELMQTMLLKQNSQK